MAQQQHMLTTVDNPFDPVTQFDEWYAYDRHLGYHTLEVLARMVRSSDELSEADQVAAEELAIDELVREDELQKYRKVPFAA